MKTIVLKVLNLPNSVDTDLFVYCMQQDVAVSYPRGKIELISDTGLYDLDLTTEAIINALDSLTWYNGLAEIIVKWKDECYLDNNGSSLCLNWNTFDSYDKSIRAQLEVIWMICVELFGNYGTSPRSGWIELKNKGRFYKFIDCITETYRDFREKNSEG